MVLAGKEMIRPVEKSNVSDQTWGVISSALVIALNDLDVMRQTEGDYLAKDLEQRLDDIGGRLNRIKTVADTLPVLAKERLMDRLSVLVEGPDILDPVRIAQEVALIADKSDISEEIVRAHSHLLQFRDCIHSDEPGGRKLNFLVQELNREFNTMGSKAGKTAISHEIVNLKSELEKIREQVQNIE